MSLSEEITLSLTLTRDEWCEVANAVSSKVYLVRNGRYDDESLYDSGIDPEAWVKTLGSAYQKIANVLDQAEVLF